MDLNIKNYTLPELLIILDLDDVNDTDLIKERTNVYIKKYNAENNKNMSTFFQDMQNALLNYSRQIEESGSNDLEYPLVSDQTRNWLDNIQSLPQDNKVQREKITDRDQKVDVYNNAHVPMNQEQLGVNNTYNVDVVQDGKLNPTLKNTVQRQVVLDSFYRQASFGNGNTDYTLDLSDQLKDVLSLRLWSVQIPMTYYVIDSVYGNTCFWITDGNNNIAISITPGNYSPAEFVIALNAGFTQAGFVFAVVPASYSVNNAKLTFILNGGVYTPPVGSEGTTTFTINPITTVLTLFDFLGGLQCNDTCVPQSLGCINQTLGWMMGFRTAISPITSGAIVPPAVLDLNGPRYLILSLDDYNQNHLNNGLVTITEMSQVVKMPNYYSPDLPYQCVPDIFGPVQQLVQSSPRVLTQPQLYTINEILKNNVNTLETRLKAPTTTDVFAIIPIKQGTGTGELYVDFSGPLQDSKRTYFGPVNIDRMRLRLFNDKGSLLNLNGADWAITLIAESLYQY